MDGKIDLISKLASEVILATNLHNIQGSGILHEKHFPGPNFAFFERKVVLNEVHQLVLTKPACGGQILGEFPSSYEATLGLGLFHTCLCMS